MAASAFSALVVATSSFLKVFRVPAGLRFGFGFSRVSVCWKYSGSGFYGFKINLKIGFHSGSGLERYSKPVGFSGSGKPDHALLNKHVDQQIVNF